jgi:hypothetical protein
MAAILLKSRSYEPDTTPGLASKLMLASLESLQAPARICEIIALNPADTRVIYNFERIHSDPSETTCCGLIKVQGAVGARPLESYIGQIIQ